MGEDVAGFRGTAHVWGTAAPEIDARVGSGICIRCVILAALPERSDTGPGKRNVRWRVVPDRTGGGQGKKPERLFLRSRTFCNLLALYRPPATPIDHCLVRKHFVHPAFGAMHVEKDLISRPYKKPKCKEQPRSNREFCNGVTRYAQHRRQRVKTICGCRSRSAVPSQA